MTQSHYDEAPNSVAINSSDLYIDLNGKGKGTLTGKDVAQDLVKAKVERVLEHKETMQRAVDAPSESNLFSAGQINASAVEISILSTQLEPYVHQCFYDGTCIPHITVFWVSIIGGKYTVNKKVEYSDCYITQWATHASTIRRESDNNPDEVNLNMLNFAFRANQRKETLYVFSQEGTPQGHTGSLINLAKGTLKSPA